MSNATWACFDCRETVRRPGYAERRVLCPNCGEPCRYLGTKWRLPPKSRAKQWQELLETIQQQAIECVQTEAQLRRQRVREIKAEIKRLEAKGATEGRAKQVRFLRRQVAYYAQRAT